MKKHKEEQGKPNLRQQANRLLAGKTTIAASGLSDFETLKLLHELEVHQVELELQNEELLNSREATNRMYEKYIELYDFSPNGYFTLTREGLIEDLNLSGAKMLGKTRSKIKNTQFSGYFGADNRQAVNSFLQKVFTLKKEMACQLTLTAADNQPRVIHLAATVKEEAGQCFLTITDITDLNEAKEQLYDSEHRYEEMFSNSPDAYLILVDGIVDECNMAARKIFGLPESQITGRSFAELSLEYQADGQMSSEIVNKNAAKALSLAKDTTEWTFRASDGSEVIVEISVAPIEWKGRHAIFLALRDISARRNAEKSLSDNEKKFRSLFESMVQGVVYQDKNGNIISANPAAERILGLTMEQMLGRKSVDPNWRAIHRDGTDFPGNTHPAMVALETGQLVHDVIMGVFNPLNSFTTWININATPQFISGQDKPYQVFTTFEDITERISSHQIILDLNAHLEKRIEQRTKQLNELNTSLEKEIAHRKHTESELLESREQLDLVIKGSNDAPWDMNLVTGKMYCFSKFWEQMGYDKDNIPSCQNFWQEFTHPDDIANVQSVLDNSLKSNQSVFESEFRLLHKKGHYFPILSRGYISRDDTGKAFRITGTNTDLTERKKAEEVIKWNKSLLELMANSSPFGFLVVDNRNDDIMHFNHRFCEIWEIEQIEDLMRRRELKYNDIIPYCLPVLADIPAFAESCKPLQSEDNRIVVLDLIPFTKNRTIQRFSTQIRGENDEYYGRFYIFEDITDRKNAENELLKAKLEAEMANSAKSEFLSRMSHELRTPLNSILGFAQLLNMDDLTSGQKKGIGHILKGGKHLLEMINEVLDISRIEAGQLFLSIADININRLLYSMMDVVKPMADEREVSLQYVSSNHEEFFVRADELKLNQVMLNLLNNAVKYNITGGTVIVKTQKTASGDYPSAEFVRISVTNTGKGISKNDIPRLFIPFERIGAESSEIEGTGLGLAVVKKLVDAMAGKLGVESSPDSGTTFWIELLSCSNSLARGEVKIADYPSGIVSTTGNGVVLYIEDNLPNIELVQMIIESQHNGIILITSHLGESAVPLGMENAPDLILLDLNLPDLHGRQVLRNLKQETSTRDIPVVIVSADALPHQLQILMNEGASDYLTKPISLDNFNRIINKYIPLKPNTANHPAKG